MKIETVIHIPGTVLGEGPVWDYRSNLLRWVDIPNGLIHTYHPKSKSNWTFSIGQMVGAVAPCDNGDLLLAMQNGFGFYNPRTNQLTPIANPEENQPLNRFNDGKCDPAGRFWAGTMAMQPPRTEVGSFYRLGSDLKVKKMLSNAIISNGLAWTKKANKMYYIDTGHSKIWSFNYDLTTGNISNQQIFKTFETDYPDGMTIDEDDNLWVAFYLGGKVVCFDSKTGKKITQIDVPALCITSCTFGGENLDTLYITSAAKKGDKLGGALFSVKPGVKGRKVDLFKVKE